MRFAEPGLLWLLLAVPLLALGGWVALRRRRRILQGFAGGAVGAARLSAGVSPHRRAAKLLLLLLATTAGVVAAARPQWGTRLDPVTRHGVDVVLVIDTSLSMAAADAPPSRLEQALHVARALLTRLSGDRVALVTFAATASLDCPLTLDHEAVRLFLEGAEVEAAPVQGTSLAEALRVSVRAFDSTGQEGASERRGRAVVVLSDGEDHEGGLDSAIGEVKSAGARLHVVACGTREGAPIPVRDERGVVAGYKKDTEGRLVTSRADLSLLEDLALKAEGRFYMATPSELEVEAIVRALSEMEAGESGIVLRARYEERYGIPLLIAFLALLAEAVMGDGRSARARRWRTRSGDPAA